LIVFQDPLASLTRMPVGVSIAEPLKTLEPQLSRNPARRVRHQRSASA
jgi:ABC-type microcin C transport system duplicated ATPase subunit YejF